MKTIALFCLFLCISAAQAAEALLLGEPVIVKQRADQPKRPVEKGVVVAWHSSEIGVAPGMPPRLWVLVELTAGSYEWYQIHQIYADVEERKKQRLPPLMNIPR